VSELKIGFVISGRRESAKAGNSRARPVPGIGADPLLGHRARPTAEPLKQLAKAAYELDAFKPNLTRTEADIRVAALKAKLKLLDGPPHTL
jgi:hypothetical protein